MSNGQKNQTPTLNSLLQKPAVMATGQSNTLTTLNPTAYSVGSMGNLMPNSQFLTNSMIEPQNTDGGVGVCYAPPNMPDPRWAFARFAGPPNVIDVKMPSDSNQMKPIVPSFPHSMTPGNFQPMQLRPFIPPAAGNPVYYGVEQSYATQGNFVGPGPPPPQAISTPPMRTSYPMDVQEPQSNGVLPKFKNNPSPSSQAQTNNSEQSQLQNAPQHRVVAALRQENSSVAQPSDGRISSPGASSTGGPSSPVAQMRHSPVSPVPVSMYQTPAGYQNCFPSQPVSAMPPGGPQMVFGGDNRFKFNPGAPPMAPPGSYQLPYPAYSNPAGMSVYANGPMPPHNASPSQQQQQQQQPPLRFRGPMQMPPGADQQPNMSSAGQYRAPMQMAPGPFFSPQPQSQQQHRMPSAFRNANGMVKNISNDDRLCDNNPSVSEFNRTNGRNTPTSVDGRSVEGRRTSTPASETKKKKNGKFKIESHPSTPAPNSPGDTSSIMDDLEESSLSSPSWPRTPISPHTSSLRHNAQQHPTMGPPPPTTSMNNNSTTTPMATPSTSTPSTPSTSSKEANTVVNGPALVNRLLGDFRQNPYGSYQEWDERRRFFEHYVQFCDSNNLQLTGHPSVSKQPVDLFRLYKSVKQNGGYVEVTKKKVWREFCGMFNINQSNSASGQLKKQYSKFLLPYECYYDLNKVDPAPIIKACESKKKHKPKNPAAKANAAQQSSSFVGPPAGTSNSNNNSASTDGQCPPPISYQQLPNATPPSYGSQNHPGFPTPTQPSSASGGAPPTNGPSNEMAVNPFDDCTIRVPQPQQLPQPPTAAAAQQQQQLQHQQLQQQQQMHQQYQHQNVSPHPSALQYPVRVPNPSYPNAFQPTPPMSGNVYSQQPADHRPQFAMPMDGGNYMAQGSSSMDPYQKSQEKPHPSWPDSAAAPPPPPPAAGQQQPPPPPHLQQPPHQQMLHQQPPVSAGPNLVVASSANNTHAYPNFLTTTASPADVVSPPNQYIVPPTSRPPPFSHPMPPAHGVPNPNVEQHLQQYVRPLQQYSNSILPSQNNMNNHPPVSSSPYGSSHQHYPPTVTTLAAVPPSLHQPHAAGHFGVRDGRMQQQFGPNLYNNGPPPGINNFVRPSGEFINSKPLSVTSLSTAQQHRKDLASLLSPFPPNSIEATTPRILKRKKFCSKDIGKIDAWRLVMALKSGLTFETSWALNVLTILLYDDSSVTYFDLKNLPGLFDALIRLFRKSVCEVFDGIDYLNENVGSETYFHPNPADVDEQTIDPTSKKVQVPPKFVRYNGDFTSISRKGRVVRIEHSSKKRLHDGSIEEDESDGTKASPSKRMKFKKSDADDDVDCSKNFNAKLKTLFNDDIDSDEVLTRLAPPIVDDRIENEHRKSLDICLATSNIIRALSFIPGNDSYIANIRWSTFINAEAKLLTYVHRHIEKRKSKHQSSSVEIIEAMDQISSADDKTEEPVELEDSLWYYNDLLTLADDAFVVLSNISANLDLINYDERTVETLLSAVIHWAVCKAPIASDSLPNAGVEATPPYRLALEILCKLSVFEHNVDLILATPPWSRIETLVERLSSFISLAEDIIVREFAVVLLHAFCNVSPVVCVVAALKTPAVSNLLCFLEFADSEMHRVLQYHGMAALRDNPEIIGTSVGMLRRASSILLAVSKIASCCIKFIGCEMRLINLTMSQLMDSRVGSTIAEVLYELQKENETGAFNVVVINQPGTVVVGVAAESSSSSNGSNHNKNSTELTT